MNFKALSCPENYFPVSKHCLMKLYGEITFDLYTFPPGENHLKEPVLLMGKNNILSKVQDIVAERGFEQFFIRKEDQQNFHHLIENFVHMLVEDRSIPLGEKSQIVYECASNVVKDIFSDPRSGKT